MALWDDELEALRPQLREETAVFVAAMPWREDAGTDLPLADRVAAHRAASMGGPPSERAVDRTIDGPAGPIRLRTLVPDEVDGVMFHIHGGAWMAGSPEMMRPAARDPRRHAQPRLRERRLPPRARAPLPRGSRRLRGRGVLAARARAGRVRLGPDRDRRRVGRRAPRGGDVAADARPHDAASRFLGANLVFGAYDLSRTPSQLGVGIPPGSDILDGTGFPLDLFLPGMTHEERRTPDVSPLYADLRGMPPALFTVGGNDHLVDDTLFMAARWELAGNDTELIVYPDTPHGCIALPTVAARFFPRLFDFFRERLAAADTPVAATA